MPSHLALPRRCHLDEVLHMFAYLNGHTNSEMVYDLIWIEFYRSEFRRKDWSYYIYTKDGCVLSENIPPNMTKTRGKGMFVMVYVESDQDGDTVTRRSITVFFIFFNFAPIYWSSKKQTSCKTSSFGS